MTRLSIPRLSILFASLALLLTPPRALPESLSEPHALVVHPSVKHRHDLETASARSGRVMVGQAILLDLEVRPRESLDSDAFGVVRSTPGLSVWTGVVRSPGSAALRLHLTDLRFAEQVEIFVDNRDGEAFGPYTGRDGELWIPPVGGAELRLQLRADGDDSLAALLGSSFSIRQVVHLGAQSLRGRQQSAAKSCFLRGCVENASCYQSPSFLADLKKAVSYYEFVDGGDAYACTGAMINDFPTSSIPYLLTSAECVDSESEASSLVAYFDYAVFCGTSCGLPSVMTAVAGAGLLTTNPGVGQTLLRLSAEPGMPYYRLGWNWIDPVTPGETLYRISHPDAGPQAYSTHQVLANPQVCAAKPIGDFIYSSTTLGAIAPGSGGSVVVNDAGQIVGVGNGTCPSLTGDDWCNTSGYTVTDGAFASFYPQVATWLQPNQHKEVSARLNPSKCIHKKNPDWNNGNPLHLWDCDAGPFDNKSWTYDGSTGYIRGVLDPSMCWHKMFDNWDNGNPIHIWGCDQGPVSNKTWVYDSQSGLIHSLHFPDKCIHKKDDGWANGNPIHLWDCWAGPQQNKSWTFGS